MKASIKSVGSFWYTAWINAGQPELENLQVKKTNTTETFYKNKKLLLNKRKHDY